MQMQKNKFNLICSGLLTGLLIACGSASTDSTAPKDTADDVSKPYEFWTPSDSGGEYKTTIDKRSAMVTEINIDGNTIKITDIGWSEFIQSYNPATLRNYTKIEFGKNTGYFYRENNFFIGTFDHLFLTIPKKLWAEIIKFDSAAFDDGMEFFKNIHFKKQNFNVDTTNINAKKCIFLTIPNAFYFDHVGNSDLNTYVEYDLTSQSIVGFPNETPIEHYLGSSHLDKCQVINVKDL